MLGFPAVSRRFGSPMLARDPPSRQKPLTPLLPCGDMMTS